MVDELDNLAVNFALFSDPVAQLFVFPAFRVHSSSMIVLEINEILKLLIPNFVMMVSFLQRCHIHCIPISNNHPIFLHYTVMFFNKIYFIELNYFVFIPFIRPVYQASLSDQFIRSVYQHSLSEHFIIPVYKNSLSGQFIIPSLCVSIIFISHLVFMKTRRLYQSNYISLQLCLCITLKKGYIPNQYYSPISILETQHQMSNPFYLL